MDQTTDPGPPPPPAAAPGTGPRVSAAQARDVARLQRSADDRKVAGVAGGLGRHLDVDPTLVRVLLVVLCFFGGAGFVLYAVAWLLVPDERTGQAVVPSGDATRSVLLYVALGVGALLALGGGWSSIGHGPGVPLGLLAVLGVGYLLLRDTRRAPAGTPPGTPVGTPVGTPDPSAPAPWPGEQPGVTDETAPLQRVAPGHAAAVPRAAWAPPPYVPPSARRAAPPRPRRTGLLLVWPTLGVVVVALVGLGAYDAGHDVAPAAYPALALALVGVALVVGAFRGRPGGLVLLGVVSALTLGGVSAADGIGRINADTYDPRTAGEVRAAYPMESGRLSLNLSNLADVEALDGRTITVDGQVGEMTVVVPRDLRVDVDASVSSLGGIDVGRLSSSGGTSSAVSRTFSGSAGDPVITLHLHLQSGHIEVRNDYE